MLHFWLSFNLLITKKKHRLCSKDILLVCRYWLQKAPHPYDAFCADPLIVRIKLILFHGERASRVVGSSRSCDGCYNENITLK